MVLNELDNNSSFTVYEICEQVEVKNNVFLKSSKVIHNALRALDMSCFVDMVVDNGVIKYKISELGKDISKEI